MQIRGELTIELALGSVIRRLRKERGLSQLALSACSKMDRTYISLIECGKKNPTLSSICNFAQGLNVPPQRIFSEVETLMIINGNRIVGRKDLAVANDGKAMF